MIISISQPGTYAVASVDIEKSWRSFSAATERDTPSGNLLLARLPYADRERIRRDLEPVCLHVGDIAMETSGRPSHAMFPVRSILSLQSPLSCGAAVEFAGVGNEGWVGVGLVLGGSRTPWRAVVQAGGLAYRLPSETLSREFQRGGPFANALLGYIGAMVAQMATVAACNRRHTLEQQLSRWFLIADDRLGGKPLMITHEMVANILGVRREAVTLAAGRWQRAGMIESRRGQVRVMRRDLLLGRTCECYAAVRGEFDHLAADPAAQGDYEE